jgi:hypothetical protein
MGNADAGDEGFSKKNKQELLDFCRGLYDERGIAAFAYPALKAIPKLYANLYRQGLSQKELLKELGIELEYKEFIQSQAYTYGESRRQRWSWSLILEKARAIQEAEGRLPPALWFQKNGHGSFVQALYNLGHTWDQLREAVGDFNGSNFVQSRSGARWLSHAEASLSNFLYARGIEHKKGERYGKSFKEFSTNRYAIYDLHFHVGDARWVDVEVWGDKPNGHNEEKYARTRAAKEAYNASNPNFVGVHHEDCYDEGKLTELLSPFIGTVRPFKFDQPTDALIHSTHWSNADELLVYCKELAAKMPGGEFPADDWLRKRGRWADREGEPFNTLSVYIKTWLGGVRNLRKLIGQADVSTKQWDESSALDAYKVFYTVHGLTPQQVRHNSRRKGDLTLPEDVILEAARIASAVEKYAGGATRVNQVLGIKLDRQTKWSKSALLEAVKHVHDEYGASPNQILYDHRKGKIQLPEDVAKKIGRI